MMRFPRKTFFLSLSMLLLVVFLGGYANFGKATAQSANPLPSWNDGAAKKAIVDFVQATTTQGSSKFVPIEERIATFNQAGTLWVSHPMYTQVMYILESVPAWSRRSPNWPRSPRTQRCWRY